jgi:hypothetical protein
MREKCPVRDVRFERNGDRENVRNAYRHLTHARCLTRTTPPRAVAIPPSEGGKGE